MTSQVRDKSVGYPEPMFLLFRPLGCYNMTRVFSLGLRNPLSARDQTQSAVLGRYPLLCLDNCHTASTPGPHNKRAS